MSKTQTAETTVILNVLNMSAAEAADVSDTTAQLLKLAFINASVSNPDQILAGLKGEDAADDIGTLERSVPDRTSTV